MPKYIPANMFEVQCHHNICIMYMCTQVDTSKADDGDTSDSSHAVNVSKTGEPAHISMPISDLPVADRSEAPSKDNADTQPENAGDEQPPSKDVQTVEDSALVEQMEMSPVKQPMAEEEVVTKVQDDAEAAPMDTSSTVLPVREQTEVVAESAAVQPESSIAVRSEINTAAPPEVSVEIRPATSTVEKQALPQQMETPPKSRVASDQSVAPPPSRKAISQQHAAPLQKSLQETPPKSRVVSDQSVAPPPLRETLSPQHAALLQKSRQETPSKSRLSSDQLVIPRPSREIVSQQHTAPLQKSRQQVTQEVKQERKHEVVCFCACVYYIYYGY